MGYIFRAFRRKRDVNQTSRMSWTGPVILTAGLLLFAIIFTITSEHAHPGHAGLAAGYWRDPATHLRWQNSVRHKRMNWHEAIAYCKQVTTGGYRDWRLPNIDELRSLIKKCPATETNGPCNIKSSDCLGSLCWDTTCNGCPLDKGRSADGMYLPDVIRANCCGYWSATTLANNKYEAWSISFNLARIENNPKAYNNQVICVR